MLDITPTLSRFAVLAGKRSIPGQLLGVPCIAAVLSRGLCSLRALTCHQHIRAVEPHVTSAMSQRGLLGMTGPVQQNTQLQKGLGHSMVYPMQFGSLVQQQHRSTCAALPPKYNRQQIAQIHTSSNTAAHVQHAPAPAHTTSAHTAPAGKPRSFLDGLSAEQLAAVQAREQHVRIIAGPGSGKTRVVAARVAWCLKQGVRPYNILVITFTRKAAGELQERLSADTGHMPHGLTACTFHSICTRLLRKHHKLTGLRNWSVADEDDRVGIITKILQPIQQEAEQKAKEQAQSPESGSAARSTQASPEPASRSRSRAGLRSSSRVKAAVESSSKEASASSKKAEEQQPVDKGLVRYFTNVISRMKNFVETTHSAGRPRRGQAIVQELQESGAADFVKLKPEQAVKLASVYDRYQRQLKWQGLLDFDDLLHHCLALVHNYPDEVAATLHKQWSHVLVDEGQDTNLCQFELVQQITGPRSKLFMVGDPDQAIYGFRGAKASMLQDRFDELFTGTSATYYLSDNYRSYSPIISVADGIRRLLRPTSHKLVPGRSTRGPHGKESVKLVAAADQEAECNAIVQQLRAWRSEGYAWDQMAVLCRSKMPLKQVYQHAITQGLPAHLQIGDFWDKPEVKTALSLLRAVVYPMAASEGLKRRVIGTTSDVKVPLTTGLGPKSIDRLEQEIMAANLARYRASSSSSSNPQVADLPSSLGGCLLAGCGLGTLSLQEAQEIWQRWQDTHSTHSSTHSSTQNSTQSSTQNSTPSSTQSSTQSSGNEGDWLAALRGLAPKWQQPPGLKKFPTKQQAGVDQLRGLVQLATAAATLGQTPKDIVQLLLDQSGVLAELEHTAELTSEKDRDKARKASNRLESLEALVKLAGLKNFESEGEPLLLDVLVSEEEGDYPQLPDSQASSSSSSNGDGSGSNGSSNGSSTGSTGSSTGGGADSSEVLRGFMDFCSLQGDGDEQGEGAGKPRERVQFLTMHSSKGKEFACVVTPAFYEGVLPSDLLNTPDELEQERNTAYVAVTRAKDRLLVTWPQTMAKRGKPWEVSRTMESRFLTDVIRLAKAGRLSGVQFSEKK